MTKSFLFYFNGAYGNLYRWFITLKVAMARYASIAENSTAARGLSTVCKFAVRLSLAVLRLLSRLLVCIVMVLWGFFATLTSRHLESTQERPKWLTPIIDGFTWFKYQVQYGKRQRIMPCALLCATTIMIFSASYFGVGLEVFVDGQSVGFVSTRDEVLDVVSSVESKSSEYLGRPYNLKANITYSLGYVQRDHMVDATALENTLFSDVAEISTKYVMYLDGQIVGANSSKTALELLKHKILSEKTPDDDNMKSSFVQELVIAEHPVANAYVKSIEDIEVELRSNTRQVTTYNAQNGDTVEKIAQQYGLSTQAIHSLNPDIKSDEIPVGFEIRIAAAVPLLSVRSTKTVNYSETIPYDVKVEYDAELYKNQSKVTQKGSSGEAAVTANVVYIDGQEVGREVVNYVKIAEPVLEIKMMGTKALPAKAASGTFMWPFRGILSSRYGYRWGGEFHNALDIAGPAGSPVVAADGGTVTLARWNGNLGYCVIIDHGNGLQTVYGHNSKLTVSQGQKVAKGERIALVGSTGRSSGPHVHFEVKKNGKNVNPSGYLP